MSMIRVLSAESCHPVLLQDNASSVIEYVEREMILRIRNLSRQGRITLIESAELGRLVGLLGGARERVEAMEEKLRPLSRRERLSVGGKLKRFLRIVREKDENP